MSNRGYLQALAAFGIWGLLPLYWRPLRVIPANQLMAYRVVLSAVVLLGVVLVSNRVRWRRIFPDRRGLAVHAGSGLLIGLNWLVFLYAVSTDRVVESSLGYFMTPLVSVLLGVVVLRERLSSLRAAAAGCAAVGVTIMTIDAGVPPWLALTLAVSFGLYGLVRKLSPLSPIEGSMAETFLLLGPILIYLGWQAGGSGLVVPTDWRLAWLMVAGVATMLPLVLFAAAAQSIPLNAVGILQYLNPFMQLVIGVAIFGESVSRGRLSGFVAIWIGLVLFALDGWRHRGTAGGRKLTAAVAART